MKKSILVLTAAAMVTAAAVPALAETSLYGSARVATFYDISQTYDAKTGVDAGKYSGFDEHLQGNSALGVNFNNGEVGGRVEVGAGSSTVSTRLVYGTWNFGSGKLTIGQDYNSYYLGAAQVHGDDNALKGYGALWDNRLPQLRVNLNNGLYFAAIQPYQNTTAVVNPAAGTPNASGAAVPNSESVSNNKIYLPKLNVGYAGKAGVYSYNTGVVGQFYENDSKGKNRINALLGYLSGSAAFGSTTVTGNAGYAQNAGNLGLAGRLDYNIAKKDNARGFEGFVQVSQKLSDRLKANVGAGYVYDKRSSDKSADDKLAFFINAPVTLAKNVSVIPEFSYYDELSSTNDVKQAKSYAVGAQFRIDF
ncbi:MAG: hypothetical protein FIA91_11705 [Geobacter sp.]|nr:hypothetical protein [Geobacter sp.]